MTQPSKIALALATAVTLASCASVPRPDDNIIGIAALNDSSGTPTGEARLISVGDSIEVAVTAYGLTPGEHGFHIHTTGRCIAPDYASAGGHLNPGGHPHGDPSSARSHLGAMPNLTVSASGTASDRFTLGTGAEQIVDAIFDTDGAAVIIHADPDDYVSQPSGNAGARVACGVLRRL